MLIFYGSPVVDGTTRFHYYASVPSFVSRVPTLILFCFFFWGAIYSLGRFGLFHFVSMFFSVVILVLFGEKFTFLYLGVCFS